MNTKRTISFNFLTIFIATIWSTLVFTSPIAAEFPDKKLEIMVYTDAGGLIDITARKVAQIMQKYQSGTPVIVTNKPGAGGIVAVSQLIRKPADGYTILGITNSVISKHIQSHKEQQLAQLDYVARMVTDYECLISNKSGTVKDFQTLLNEAHTKAGNQIWAGPAIGGTDHLFAQQVWESTGISARWIPYPSGSQAIASVLGKHASVYVGNPSDIVGRPALQVVAVASPSRLSAFPNVPTFHELGHESLTGSMLWRGFVLKKGTPDSIRKYWEDTLQKVSEDPEWKSFVETNFMIPAFDTRDHFDQMVLKQVESDQKFFKKG